MNRNLHDIDDLFRTALDAQEETPSAGVKEKLDAALDKVDAGSYKKRFLSWKRTALALLLFITGFIFYESGIFKKGSDRPHETATVKKINYPSAKGAKENIERKIPATEANNAPDFKNGPSVSKSVKKNNLADIQLSNEWTGAEKNENEIQSETGKSNNNSFNPTKLFASEKLVLLPFLRQINVIKKSAGQINSIINLNVVNDPHSKNSIAKNAKENKATAFKPFWMLAVSASYERAGYRLDSDLPTNITNIKHSEVHEPSFSLGVLATRQLKKHLGLQTGIMYFQTDIGISPQKLYAMQDPVGQIAFKYNTSSGFKFIKPGLGNQPAMGDSLTTKEGKHSLKYASVPLVIKFSVGNNKLQLTPGAGVEANFLTSAKVEMELESPSNPEIIFINKLDGTKPLHLSIVADAEVRYQLHKKLSISLRPVVRFATSPITENNVVETFPRSIGVGTGLTWKF